MEQRSAEWFAARKGRVTASSVGAILGNSPNATRADVLRRMVREHAGAENEFTGNIATEYGVNNEAGAVVEFTMETGLTVDPAGFVTKEDWAGASPDGFIRLSDGTLALLEVKCPFGLRAATAPVPFKTLADQPHYNDQMQFQLWVTGCEFCYFWQWAFAETRLEIVHLDLEWQAVNLPKLRQFFAEYLDACKAPEPHLADKRVTIDTPEAQRMVAEYDQLAEAIENAESRRKELLASMVRLAGERNAVFGGRNLTKTERAGSVAYAKAIAKYAPDADLEPFRGKPVTFWGLK